MPTFGFSAFLKMLSLRARPQRTLLRSRLGPSTGGYDFHRSFRLRAHRFMTGQETMAEIEAGLENITRDAERRSATSALGQLGLWRAAHPGDLLEFSAVTFESPGGIFKISFEPTFGLVIGGKRTAIHVWNNAVPDLSEREAIVALGIIAPQYEGIANRPDDFAVLSVRSPHSLFRLGDAPEQAKAATRVVNQIERLIGEVSEEMGIPGQRPENRPTA